MFFMLSSLRQLETDETQPFFQELLQEFQLLCDCVHSDKAGMVSLFSSGHSADEFAEFGSMLRSAIAEQWQPL